jgi:hypothetical protein
MDRPMLRIALLRLLATVAFFAATWLAPLRVFAAIIPVCDGNAVSGWAPVAPALPSDPSSTDACPSSAAASDDAELHVAAMCDADAATVVAPNRIHPMSDARIDAVVSCDGIHHGPFASTPTNSHNIDGLSWVNVDPAMLTEPLVVRPRIYFELPPMFVDAGVPCTGYGREVYHPPRA